MKGFCVTVLRYLWVSGTLSEGGLAANESSPDPGLFVPPCCHLVSVIIRLFLFFLPGFYLVFLFAKLFEISSLEGGRKDDLELHIRRDN